MGRVSSDREYRARAKNAERSKAQWFWTILAFVVGYLTSGLYDVSSLQQVISTHVSNFLAKKQVKLPILAVEPPPPKPKLEFYTLLSPDAPKAPAPAVQQTPPAVATTPVVPAPAPAAHAAKTPGEQYVIQVAAFTDPEEADRMKDAWLTKGWPLQIVKIMQQQKPWYRVMVGPFESQQEAERIWRQISQQEHIQGMIRAQSSSMSSRTRHDIDTRAG